MKTPIVLIVFNRPDTTKQVFETIRQAKPSKLFVIADGPRGDHAGEAEKCDETRAILDRVDWDCEVFKNYSEVNLGCAKRVSSGLDWVFEHVEETIILEDDCVPHPTFFSFCEQMLERYRFDDRISSISAQNFFDHYQSEYSYYFSRYPHCWGWATWRRAWKHFDFDMKLWQEVKEKQILCDVLLDSHVVNEWTKTFQATYDLQVKSWGYRWVFACWLQNSLSIHPRVNLVSNIGFGSDATNTKNEAGKFVNIQTEAIEFPLHHPPFIVRDVKADSHIQTKAYEGTFFQRVKSRVENLIKM